MGTISKLVFILLIVVCFCLGFSSCQSKTKRQNEKEDINMTDTSDHNNSSARNLAIALKRKGISDQRVLDAIAQIPRHYFVDQSLEGYAYHDKPLPIDRGQTISQPYTVAFQTELLELKPNDKVLEIGTGSGYQAAVLCQMGVKVYSIERQKQLYLKAKETLNKLGYVPTLVYGDGYKGLPEYAPFDKILITAATNEFPPQLLKQLQIGGLMIAPIGEGDHQTMTVIERIGPDEYREMKHGAFRFVPMIEGIEE